MTKLTIVGGSNRNHANQDTVVKNVKEIKSEPFLYEYIERTGREGKISNSEGCAIAAAYGALQEGVDVRYVKLNRHFLANGKTRNLDELFGVLEESDGLIFALPVYFGDRSSLFDEFIQNWRSNKVNLDGKIFGFLSVGAKRNGGQETTNIYGIQNVTELGGLAVGNGPPTSQFGGTAVGGNMGTMENDYFGIMTSNGTGKKVAQVSKILGKGKENSKDNSEKIKITFFILQEFKNKLKSQIESMIHKRKFDNVDFDIIDLNDYNFNRCYACDVCPNGDKTEDYKCIDHNDDMEKLHSKIINNDGIMLCGLNLKDVCEVKNIYQTFVERTRYLRRDDFRLTNILASTFLLGELGTHRLFNLRAMTSFIRHNMVIHGGIYKYLKDGKIIYSNALPILESFIRYSRFLSIGRDLVDIGPTLYAPVGYSQD